VWRHQSGFHAERVRLTSADGCETIAWAPAERGAKTGSSSSTSAAATSTNGKGQRAHGWLHYLGYQRHGHLVDLDITAVLAATAPDPAARPLTTGGPPLTGSASLRASADKHVPGKSFSVRVARHWLPSVRGPWTLDVECETAETYDLLFRGFQLLLARNVEEAARRRDEEVAAGGKDGQGRKGGAGQDGRSGTAHVARPADPVTALYAAPARGLRGAAAAAWRHARPFPSRAPAAAAAATAAGPHAQHPLSPDSTPLAAVPPAQFLGWHSAGTQIWARLRMAGLEVKCVFSWDLRRVMLKLRCPQHRLEEVAERMHLKVMISN